MPRSDTRLTTATLELETMTGVTPDVPAIDAVADRSLFAIVIALPNLGTNGDCAIADAPSLPAIQELVEQQMSAASARNASSAGLPTVTDELVTFLTLSEVPSTVTWPTLFVLLPSDAPIVAVALDFKSE